MVEAVVGDSRPVQSCNSSLNVCHSVDVGDTITVTMNSESSRIWSEEVLYLIVYLLYYVT